MSSAVPASPDKQAAYAAAWAGHAKSVNNAAMARFLSLRGAEADRATRPFEQVGAVNRCIRMRTAAISGMPLMVSTPDDELVESGEIIDLLNQPWPGATGGPPGGCHRAGDAQAQHRRYGGPGEDRPR